MSHIQVKAWGERYTHRAGPTLCGRASGSLRVTSEPSVPSRVAVLQLFLRCLKTLLPERAGFGGPNSTSDIHPPDTSICRGSPGLSSWWVRYTNLHPIALQKEIHRELVQRRAQSEDHGHAWKRLGKALEASSIWVWCAAWWLRKRAVMFLNSCLQNRNTIICMYTCIFPCGIWIIHTQVCIYLYTHTEAEAVKNQMKCNLFMLMSSAGSWDVERWVGEGQLPAVVIACDRDGRRKRGTKVKITVIAA